MIFINVTFACWTTVTLCALVNTLIVMKYTGLVTISILGVLPYTFRSQVEARGRSDWLGKDALDNNAFPKDFLFGVSISAPQYEGGWNVSGRGQSVWDYMSHTNSKLIQDESNMDIANDFYHKYKEDIRLAKSIGTEMFKLSFSWSRLLPKGFTNYINKDGVRFYKNIIDEILANGMAPMVTLFQWDLPYDMQKMGGLSNPLFVDWFEQYAKFVFSTFGDKVKFWMTINEPNSLCFGGYSYEFIPLLNISGIADYLCGHHALLAHARVYRLYEREFRPRQNGKVGYTINFQSPEPMDRMSQEDIKATEDVYQWTINGLLHPIFSNTGDYSRVMKERIANYSRIQGFATSRLSSFTKEQIRDVRGSADFLGLTYYTYDLIKAQFTDASTVPLFDRDVGAAAPQGFQYKDAPRMLAKMIQRINKDYHPTIYITENGFPDASLKDTSKVAYLRGHLAEVLKAIRNGVDIRGYFVWSLLDSFQWQFGYQPKFGLFQVDFNDPNRARTPRLSAKYISHVYKTRRLEDTSDFNNLLSLRTTT